ncbi:MAG: hypothetical protein OXG58_02610 [Gemmatimonadetes bacterium]|nr:hypothetical protein [Gemmatimonadota bacterium]MCY3942282.1 hypothetical protein [Gemmatimonadota bacterium]
MKSPDCSFCGSARTELMSLFGSHASLSTFWCAACRSPFEVLRWREEEVPGGRSDRRPKARRRGGSPCRAGGDDSGRM